VNIRCPYGSGKPSKFALSSFHPSVVIIATDIQFVVFKEWYCLSCGETARRSCLENSPSPPLRALLCPETAPPTAFASTDLSSPAVPTVPQEMHRGIPHQSHLLASDTGNGCLDPLSGLVARLVRLCPDHAR